MCARDTLFFWNTFLYTHDPRLKPKSTVVPFITWPYQEDIIIDAHNAIGNEDYGNDKSRDMGVSWIACGSFLHPFIFNDLLTFIMMSRKADLVDKKGAPGCLFWKIDFMLKYLPSWLRPKIGRKELQIENQDNGSVINGESTTSDASRGGRATAMMLDEYPAFPYREALDVRAAAEDVSNCLWYVGTPKGDNHPFADIMRRSDIKRRSIHWTEHPHKARGLIIKADGNPSSPWYERECKRRSPVRIAQELDIDYQGSSFTFFDNMSVKDHITEYARPPYLEGVLDFDRETFEPAGFRKQKGAPLRLWVNVDVHGRVPVGKYSIGADVAFGTGATPSCLSVYNTETGEKAAEYICNTVAPTAFANVSAAIGKWFCNALICHEHNGPGGPYVKRLQEIGYHNLYRREHEGRATRKRTQQVGWHSSASTKITLLEEYRDALLGGGFVNRSEAAMLECLEYEFTQSGKLEHMGSVNSDDPSASGDHHGDLVIADALALRGATGVLGKEAIPDEFIPENSIAGRTQAVERELALANSEWSNSDWV